VIAVGDNWNGRPNNAILVAIKGEKSGWTVCSDSKYIRRRGWITTFEIMYPRRFSIQTVSVRRVETAVLQKYGAVRVDVKWHYIRWNPRNVCWPHEREKGTE
jgi:hypothetical protein